MAFNLSPIRAFGSTLEGGIYIFVMIIVSVIIDMMISFGLVAVRALEPTFAEIYCRLKIF